MSNTNMPRPSLQLITKLLKIKESILALYDEVTQDGTRTVYEVISAIQKERDLPVSVLENYIPR